MKVNGWGYGGYAMHRKDLECQAKVQLLSGDPSNGESLELLKQDQK